MLISPKNLIPRIITDFDGIFSNEMYYNATEKNLKSFGFGIRHAFEILHVAGFEKPVIITSDTSGTGVRITQQFLHNIPHELICVKSHQKAGYIRRRFADNTYYWIGDDIYDLEIAKFATKYITVDENEVLGRYAHKSFPHKYFWLNFADWMIKTYTKTTIQNIQQYISQPDIVTAIHESMRQNFQRVIDTEIHKDRNTFTPYKYRVSAYNNVDTINFKQLIKNIHHDHYSGVIYGPHIMIDILPNNFINTLDSHFQDIILVISNPTNEFIQELKHISKDQTLSHKVNNRVKFYYANNKAAAKCELIFNGKLLEYRGIIPKLCDLDDLHTLKDKYPEDLTELGIQLKLFSEK